MEIVEEVQPSEVSVGDFATPYNNGNGLWNVSVIGVMFMFNIEALSRERTFEESVA